MCPDSTLQHCPESFDSVRVSQFLHTFADAVIDRFVLELRHYAIGDRLVRVKRRARHQTVADYTLQGRRIGLLDLPRRGPAGFPVLDARDRSLPDGTAVGHLFPLRDGHVFSLAAEQRGVAAFERRPEPVRQMPCRRIGDLQVAVQIHAAYAFEVRRQQINGDGPVPIAEIRRLHDRTDLQA